MPKKVSPGVQALRDVVEKVYRELREAKERGEKVGWSSSKFPPANWLNLSVCT